MLNENLTNYVKEARFAKIPDILIRQKLLEAGWDAADVEQAQNTPLNQVPASSNSPSGLASLLSPATVQQTAPATVGDWNRKVLIALFVGVGILLAGGVAAFFFYPKSPERVMAKMVANLSSVETLEYSGIVEANVIADSLLTLENILQRNPIASKSTNKNIAGEKETIVRIDFDGATDATDLDNPKRSFSMTVTAEGFVVGFEMRTINQDYYARLTQVPNFGAMDLGKIKNR